MLNEVVRNESSIRKVLLNYLLTLIGKQPKHFCNLGKFSAREEL